MAFDVFILYVRSFEAIHQSRFSEALCYGTSVNTIQLRYNDCGWGFAVVVNPTEAVRDSSMRGKRTRSQGEN
jgi:hypothetical protein